MHILLKRHGPNTSIEKDGGDLELMKALFKSEPASPSIKPIYIQNLNLRA